MQICDLRATIQVEKSSMEKTRVADMRMKRKPPSLLGLCLETAIDNVRHLGDVGQTDINLLGKILPHCTANQLMHIEKSNKGRDLSCVTDPLWKKFYEKKFGLENANLVMERMKAKGVCLKWMKLYEAKLKAVEKARDESLGRIRQLYKQEEARKQSRQVQLCSKVPPTQSNKRRWWDGHEDDSDDADNSKSNLMKKARKEFNNSMEYKNMAFMKKNASWRSSGGFRAKGSSSTSRQVRSYHFK